HYAYTLLYHSLTPPPPTSTLFPYTTLFRSLRMLQGGNHRKHPLLLRKTQMRLEADQIVHRPGGVIPAQLHHGIRLLAGLGIFQTDRKSTRLNSSHVSISYAVFCLKKKNIKK